MREEEDEQLEPTRTCGVVNNGTIMLIIWEFLMKHQVV